MPDTKPDIDPGITLIADHLDAALAAGEDLLAAELPAAADREAVATEDGGVDPLSRFVATLRQNEAMVVARILQARRRAVGLPRLDAAMRALIGLFVAQTAGLIDIIDTFGDRTSDRFATGGDPVALLRSRGVLAEDAAALPRFTALVVPQSYRLAGTIELGPLLDLVAATLDALDLHYDLYDDRDTEAYSDAEPAAADATPPVTEADKPAVDSKEVGASALDVSPAIVPDAGATLTPGSLAAALDTMRRAR